MFRAVTVLILQIFVFLILMCHGNEYSTNTTSTKMLRTTDVSYNCELPPPPETKHNALKSYSS